MMQQRTIKFLSLLTILAMLLTACGSKSSSGSGSSGPKGDPIKVGVIMPLSGPIAQDGEMAVKGMKLAAKQINAKGGISGRPLELVIEDGAAKPDQSASAAEKLVTKDKVVAILGAFTSGATGAVVPVTEKYKLPLMTGIATNPTLTRQGYQYFFRAVGTSEQFAGSFAKKIMTDLKVKSVDYLVVNDDWGRGSMAAFGKSVQDGGGKNGAQLIFQPDDNDFYTYLNKIKADKPEAIYMVSNTTTAVRIAQQIQELKLTSQGIRLFGEGAWVTPGFISQAGAAAEGIYGVVEYVDSVDSAVNKQFVKDFQAEYKVLPDKYAASEYNTVAIMADAIAKSGGTEAAKIKAQIQSGTFNTLMGAMKFATNGQGYGHDMYLAQVKDGKPVMILAAPVDKLN